MENTTYSAKKFIESTNQDILELAQRGKFVEIQKMFVEYAASVRTEVVVPSDELICEMICGMVFIRGVDLDNYIDEFKNDRSGLYDSLLSELRRLNPTLAFTELNHEK